MDGFNLVIAALLVILVLVVADAVLGTDVCR